MPWKLVSFLFLLILATLFIGFNLENRCDVSFIFYTFKDVPIFVSLLFSYAVGALTVIPFFWAHGIRKNRRSASGGVKAAASGKNGKFAGSAKNRTAPSARDYDID